MNEHCRGMGFLRSVTVAALLGFASLWPAALTAQTTTGAIAGRVVDQQNLALDGALVRVSSSNLQGIRTTTTSATGDYLVPLLPPGLYSITVEFAALQRHTSTVVIASGRTSQVNVTLDVAPIAEQLRVGGTFTEVFTGTSQLATTFPQSLLAALPTNRTLDAALLLSPSVHPTGPFGAPSIAGAMSFESVFLVDGVVVNDTIRGQPLALYIEDAIQETTVFTGGISAEYGRFAGGAANLITRSGGNAFSGSFRDTLVNDRWRALTPFAGDTRTDNVIATPEFTFGGPVLRDRLWFFTAGRSTNVEVGRTALTVPYTFADTVHRYEGKVTYGVAAGHSISSTYVGIRQSTENIGFSTAIDIRSLYDRQIPQSLFALTYNGVLSPRLSIEGRLGSRRMAIENEGARTRDLIEGTLLIDRARNRRYWSPTFCGICDSDKRYNDDLFVKASYLAAARGSGSHELVAGYDTFNDIRSYNNHQSGSDYRILGTTAIIDGSSVYPVFVGDGSTIIQYNPIERETHGTDFRVHSLFANDTWRFNDHWTFNLGVRWDKNHGRDAADQGVSTSATWSPRLGVAWDPRGTGTWVVTGSVSRYVGALANVVADISSPAGRSTAYQWEYRGPSINTVAGAPPVTPDAAIRQVFSWFDANGGRNRPLVSADVPGVSTRIPGSLESPNVIEYVAGVSRAFGARGAIRLDVTRRAFRDFYFSRVDTGTGVVSDAFGRRFDLSLIENTNALERSYAALTVAGTYRPMPGLEAGGNYTLSRTRGNFEGEDTTGPIASTVLAYPEYKSAAWSSPEGDVAVDQRHRANVWALYQTPIGGLTVGLVERIGSGVPYGAAGLVDARPFVVNPGYVTPQGGNSQRYYYTARDAFRTETSYRTDASVNYTYPITLAGRRLDLFTQVQILNVFNTFAIVNPASIDVGVLDPVLASARFQRFNPFTTTPVEGVNWARSPTFGQPFAASAYNIGRTFSMSFGARF